MDYENDYSPTYGQMFEMDFIVVCTKVVEVEADTEENAIAELEEMIGRGEIDLDFNFSDRIPNNVGLIDMKIR